MEVVKFILRCWRALLGKDRQIREGIDSHKWESKMQVLSSLSRRRR